mgnify:CR=1 FL=1
MNSDRMGAAAPVSQPAPISRCTCLARACGPLSVAALAAFTFACKPQPQAPLPPPIVQVSQVATTNAPVSLDFIGQLDSPQNIEVRARVEAFVDKVIFTEGKEVKEGEPLFALDKKPFEQKLAEAKGALAEAKAGLNKYQKDVARLKPLAEKRAIPQQDLDNAVASVAVGEGNVQSAEAQVASAVINLGYCDIRAPAAGLIGATEVSVGNLVGKGEPTLLATISQLDPIWFYCNVSEVDYLRADAEAQRTGKRVRDMDVKLLLADGSTHPEKGRFVFLDRAVDTKTGTIRFRAEFPNPEKKLRPGMFARLRVETSSGPGRVLVPERAVQELQGKNFVWLVSPDNKACQRAVKASVRIGSCWLVEEGLEPGQRIILEGIQKVREGGLVQPMTAAEMTALAAQQAAAAAAAQPQGKE